MEIVICCFGVLMGLGEAAIIKYMLLRRSIVCSSVILWQRTALISVITGICFVIAYIKLGWRLSLIHALVFICFLIVIAAIDFWYGLIIRPVIVAMLVTGFVMAMFSFTNFSFEMADLIIGCSVGGSCLFLLAWGSGKMGYGDAWFAAALGLWLGWQALLMLLWLAFLSGGVVGVILLATGVKNRKDPIPFGPFLAIAAFIAYFYYSDMIIFIGQLYL